MGVGRLGRDSGLGCVAWRCVAWRGKMSGFAGIHAFGPELTYRAPTWVVHDGPPHSPVRSSRSRGRSTLLSAGSHGKSNGNDIGNVSDEPLMNGLTQEAERELEKDQIGAAVFRYNDIDLSIEAYTEREREREREGRKEKARSSAGEGKVNKAKESSGSKGRLQSYRDRWATREAAQKYRHQHHQQQSRTQTQADIND